MYYERDLEQLRERLRDFERKAESSRWLIKQLRRKIANFPRDLLRRLRRSIQKRRIAALLHSTSISDAINHQPVSAAGAGQMSGNGQPPVQVCGGQRARLPIDAGQQNASLQPPFIVCGGQLANLSKLIETQQDVRNFIAHMESYKYQDLTQQQVAAAIALDPNIGAVVGTEDHYLAPWHDVDYEGLKSARARLPEGPFEAVILVPFGKLGGADFVAGVLASAVSRLGPTLIVRTDGADWDRPDWYPEGVPSVDLSDIFARIQNQSRALYALLQYIAPLRIYNVNSRLCFETMTVYGERLAMQFRLYAYYFCADHTLEGVETGYPVWYFACLIPYLHAAFVDTAYLSSVLTARYVLPTTLAGKVRTVYTPVMTSQPDEAIVDRQIVSSSMRMRRRLLWAGRLDRQKRFDLVLKIAEAMPDVDFDCWGKAVLDAAPNVKNLPKNVTLHHPFASYDELPLAESDGWLYTSAWDGLPTILIECAALGIPITASAVGGVPELIDESTGWPVRSPNEVQAYVCALRDMLGDSQARVRKVQALQARVRERHSRSAYMAAIAAA
jgi:glycosyltransferase involved in cell wall biosynthesis